MTWPDHSEGLSIVIPTYNESSNVEPLITELASIAPQLGRPIELVLVDDRSPDGTGELAKRIAERLDVDLRVLTRQGPRSLGGSITDGLDACRWNLVCVMDADLSHPSSLLSKLIEALDGADGVVASRYAPGGVIESWPVPRRLMSLIATWIAQRALRVRCADPLSGFFLFRRQFLEAARITGVGNKPLLEVLVTSRPVVNEIPYVFRNRRNGESKLGARNIVEFLGLVLRLRSWSNGHAPARRQSSRSWDLNPPQH